MELVVVVGLLALIGVSIYGSWNFVLKILQEAKNRTAATGIANERIELIRNMPYDDIGVSGAIPSGIFPAAENIERNHTPFVVAMDVRYIDDSFDGLAPADTLNTDYKQVRVQVSWPGYGYDRPVVMWSSVAPRGVESNLGGGTLRVEVINAAAEAVSGAAIHVVNTETSPPLNFTLPSDSSGFLLLPGMPAAVQSYQITVSRSGFNSAQTHNVDPDPNPNPNPGHLTVAEGLVTHKAFTIDQLGLLTVSTTDPDGAAVDNIAFSMSGEKSIGSNGSGAPILLYQQSHQTDAAGSLALSALEFDTYDIHVDGVATSYDIASVQPALPFLLSPGEQAVMTIRLVPHAPHSLLVRIINDDDESVAGASAHLTDQTIFNETKTIDDFGYVFFADLAVDTYTLEVSAEGYQLFTTEIAVSGALRQKATLADQ